MSRSLRQEDKKTTPLRGAGYLFNQVSNIVTLSIKESGSDQSLTTLDACMPR